ncbi:MAG: hypothetical protein COZ36_08805, partial [Piscirickettsiaceae bacterium CG_4_10_14_3_um_filter_44_349]
MKNASRRQFLKLAGAATASMITGTALAKEADFGFKNLEKGYENQLASSHEGKCGEGKCGGNKKSSEGKCGGKKEAEGK